MNILGISAFYHDRTACVVRDGEIVAAAQEERFTREARPSVSASLPIGFVIARVVMGVFFGVVTPIALVFRVTGRDALERTLDRGAATYWRRRSPVVDEARCYRQF